MVTEEEETHPCTIHLSRSVNTVNPTGLQHPLGQDNPCLSFREKSDYYHQKWGPTGIRNGSTTIQPAFDANVANAYYIRWIVLPLTLLLP